MSGKENWYGQQGTLPYSHHQRIVPGTKGGPGCRSNESVETTQIQPSPITRYASSPLVVDVKGFRSPELGRYLDRQDSYEQPQPSVAILPKEARTPPDTKSSKRHESHRKSKTLALTIDLGGGRSDTIHISSKGSIGNDVQAFVRRNQLDSALAPVIQEYVVTQYEATILNNNCNNNNKVVCSSETGNPCPMVVVSPVDSQQRNAPDTGSSRQSLLLPPKQQQVTGHSNHHHHPGAGSSSNHQGTQQTTLSSRSNNVAIIDTAPPCKAEAVHVVVAQEEEAHSSSSEKVSSRYYSCGVVVQAPTGSSIREPGGADALSTQQRTHTGGNGSKSTDNQPSTTAKPRAFKNTGSSSYYKQHYQKRKQFLKAASSRRKQPHKKPKSAHAAVAPGNCPHSSGRKACEEAKSLLSAHIEPQAQAKQISVQSSHNEVLRCPPTKTMAPPRNSSQSLKQKPSVVAGRKKHSNGSVFDRLYSNGTFTCSGGGVIGTEKLILVEDSEAGGGGDSNDEEEEEEEPIDCHNDFPAARKGALDESPGDEAARSAGTLIGHSGSPLSSAPSRRLQPPLFDLSHSSDEEHSCPRQNQPQSHTPSRDFELEQALAAVPPHPKKKNTESVIDFQLSTAVGADSQQAGPSATTHEASAGSSNRIDSITERLYTAAVQKQRASLAARQSERERLEEERSRAWTCPCCGVENSGSRGAFLLFANRSPLSHL